MLTEGATPGDFVAAAAAFPRVFDQVIERLARILNETFGISRSTRYWALITHPLLYHYLLSHLIKWQVVERALHGRVSELEVDYAVLAPDSTPLLYPHLRAAYEDDDRFNLESFSEICHGLGVPEARPPASGRNPRHRGLLDAGRRKAQALYAFLVAWRRHRYRPELQSLDPHTVVVKDMAPGFVRELAIHSGLRFVDMDDVAAFRPTLRTAPDESLRRKASWTHEDPLVRSILRGLQYHLPVQQMESFPHVLEAAKRRLQRLGVPAVLTFGILERLEYRVLAAEAMCLGARLVSIQHGGNYGESVAAVSLVVERSFSDRFVTFGWQEDASLDVPAGGFRTLGLATEDAAAPEGHVLLVAPFFQEYPHHLNWSPEHRHRERRAFLDALPPTVRRRLVVRLRPGRAASARLEQEWLAPFPELRVDDGHETMETLLHGSSLVVIGYVFSTTLLEVVKMNRPFLVFDQGFETLLTPAAQPVYEALARAGLVHTDPVEAARAIGEALRGGAEWWAEPTRRAAVERFRERFVKEANLEEWMELLGDLVRGDG